MLVKKLDDYQTVLLALGNAITSDHQPGPFLKARLDLTAELYVSHSKQSSCLIVVTGGPFYNTTEADVMKQYLCSLKIPEGDILCESKARDTFENAIRVKRLLLEYGWNSVIRKKQAMIVVTSDFHIPRSKAVFEAEYADCTELTIQYQSAHTPASDERRREIEEEERALLRYWQPEVIKEYLEGWVELL